MADSGKLPEPDSQFGADFLHLTLPVSQKVVLVIDLVESVRLMAHDERGTVARWHDFAQTTQTQTIPAHQGRLVKSLGDGLMVEFEQPRNAVNAALAMHAHIASGNAGLPPERQMHLRAGVNASHVFTDNNDIYGAGVNLAARLASLAGPGETVVSASVRDGLTDGLDADIEDLGECYLKHLEQPVPAYKIRPLQSHAQAYLQAGQAKQRADYTVSLLPTIAVIPFESRSLDPAHHILGEIIAENVIAQLAHTASLKVISRLSSTSFRGRADSVEAIQKHLGADYILSGSYVVDGKRILIMPELMDTHTQGVIWGSRLSDALDDLVAHRSELTSAIASATHACLLNSEVQRAKQQPLPTLRSHSLLMGAVNLMHRTAKTDFYRAHELLLHLHERHGRQPIISAWMAKWQVLQVEQGWAADARAATHKALDNSKRALDLDPESPLALCMDGFVRCNLMRDFDTALAHYERAIEVNPSESIAWLLKGMLHAFKGETEPSLDAVVRANALSPLDPTRYFYDSLSASIYLSAGQYPAAIDHAKRSLRANTSHVSTYRALTIAQVMNGQVDLAKQTALHLLRLDPSMTVKRFVDRSPGAEFSLGKAFAMALGAAGIPA